MSFLTIYLLLGCIWMFFLQYMNDNLVIEEYRLRLGVIEVLIGMVIWPISFAIFIKSVINR
jgi:hypothetical protein